MFSKHFKKHSESEAIVVFPTSQNLWWFWGKSLSISNKKIFLQDCLAILRRKLQNCKTIWKKSFLAVSSLIIAKKNILSNFVHDISVFSSRGKKIVNVFRLRSVQIPIHLRGVGGAHIVKVNRLFTSLLGTNKTNYSYLLFLFYV